MNKFQKIFLLCCLFSYVFSLKVTNIVPKTVTLGENVNFTLTVQDLDPTQSYYYFYLRNGFDDEGIRFSCPPSSESSTTLKCNVNIRLDYKEDLNNLTKTLFLNGENTNLTVTIEKPKTLELLNFNGGQFYSYGVSSFKFYVNLNELYKSDVSIKFGEYSITNCSVSDYSISYINCYFEFPESSAGKTLKLNFGGENTDYSITIKTPTEFSSINKLDVKEYYVSSSEQDVYFRVDSSYKMNDHKFILVPETSTNGNITLSKCTYYDDGIGYGKCSGTLNKVDAYYVYVDNTNTNLKLLVYPVRTAITKVYDIDPYKLVISSSATTFTLEVDYIVNLDKAVFTLVDEYDDTNKVYLTNCKKVENSENEITCVGTIKNAGLYFVYLNGVKQEDIYVRAASSSLSKALYVYPKVIKLEPETQSYITINFDTMENFSSKKIALKGNNNEATLKISEKFSTSVEYKATFPDVDTYYVYIDDVKQDANIIVTKDDFTSKVTAISPTLVPSEKYITFTLTVDTNLGVEQTGFTFKKENDDSDTSYNSLSCKADSLEKTKAICSGYIENEGVYYVKFRNGTEFKNVKVTAKNIPSLNSFSPISISPSSKEQTITLTFKENISSYVDKVKFAVGTETVDTKCTADSNYVLQCSGVFNNEDDYYITIDGVNTGKYINVNEEDNINKEEEKKKNNNVNYLKISSLLLTLLLLF